MTNAITRAKTLMAPAAAAMALALAAPATADPRVHGRGWHQDRGHLPAEFRLEREFRQLAFAYERALRERRLDRRDAARIGRRLAEIDRLGSRYAGNGFNRGERQRLERLLREARAELRYAMRDPGWRDARWGGWH